MYFDCIIDLCKVTQAGAILFWRNNQFQYISNVFQQKIKKTEIWKNWEPVSKMRSEAEAQNETMLIKQKQSENILKKPVLPVIDIKRYIQSSSEFRISR